MHSINPQWENDFSAFFSSHLWSHTRSIFASGVQTKYSVSFRTLDVKVKHDSDSDKNHTDKTGNDNHLSKQRPADDQQPEQLRRLQDREEKQRPAEEPGVEDKGHVEDLWSGTPKSDPMKEDLKKMRPAEPLRRKNLLKETKKNEDLKKGRNREEGRHERPQQQRTPSETKTERTLSETARPQRDRTLCETKTERPGEKVLFERWEGCTEHLQPSELQQSFSLNGVFQERSAGQQHPVPHPLPLSPPTRPAPGARQTSCPGPTKKGQVRTWNR